MHGEEEVYTQRCISGKSATDGNGDGNREQSSEVRRDTLVESNRSLTFLPHAVSTANKTLIRDGRIYRTTELRCPSFLSFFSFSLSTFFPPFSVATPPVSPSSCHISAPPRAVFESHLRSLVVLDNHLSSFFFVDI